jgi:RNA polymerase sigma-70 factor (ECF subfamily)
MSADLVLVSKCVQGDAAAWQELLTRYRSTVLDFALHMTRDVGAAEEIASSVWADLYGLSSERRQMRVSKLVHYSGRGSLEGWLRTLVAQAYVDRYRKERRFVPLENEERVAAVIEGGASSVDARLENALDRAFAELRSEQRLVLAAHYLDGRTFSEIGRMIGAHESSVSRQCGKAIAFLRKRTANYLRQSGMSLAEAQEAMGADVRTISLDVRRRLQVVKNTP